ncbi:MAG: O-antigen ligase family protein [Patescibacteria group bacterium]
MDRSNYDNTARLKTLSITLPEYKQINKGIFGFLLFFTPLIFVTNTNELFEFPKTIFLYIVGTTLIWLFMLKVIIEKKLPKLGSIWALIFVLTYLLSTMFSTHVYTSVWGYYTRFNGGLVSVIILYGIYIVAINTLTKADKLKLTETILFSSVPVSIYAITQHFSFIAILWETNETTRVFSTFGQPNWLAAYLAMQLLISLYFVLIDSTKKSTLWIAIALLNFSALWFTYSISGIIGLLIGTTITAALNINKVIKGYKKILAILIICSFISITNPGIFSSKINDIYTELRKLSYVESVYAQSEYEISDTGSIRKALWQGTLDLITSSSKNVLIGTGPETFPYEFQKFRPTQLNYSSEWNFIFNKPHNYYLELWSNLGIFGLTSYLFFINRVFKKPNKMLTGPLVAFFVTNIFGWPTVATALIFWFYLSFWEPLNLEKHT